MTFTDHEWQDIIELFLRARPPRVRSARHLGRMLSSKPSSQSSQEVLKLMLMMLIPMPMQIASMPIANVNIFADADV